MIRILCVLLWVLGRFLVGAADSLAVLLGLRWRGPDGQSRWRS